MADDLDALERSAALTAVALDNWHRAHTPLPALRIDDRGCPGGWVRRCLADGSEHFPRTDPAVIVLVVDDQQRALLGRRSIWPEGWYSTLAGFVEPGETFEQAVVREVLEEADAGARRSCGVPRHPAVAVSLFDHDRVHGAHTCRRRCPTVRRSPRRSGSAGRSSRRRHWRAAADPATDLGGPPPDRGLVRRTHPAHLEPMSCRWWWTRLRRVLGG